ncbi:MAG: polysaccharide deacetylase family protein [Alloprevotella sp.]|nr:polysaccharide deacetylase family protein [Alloprevotella sp.]
MLIEQPSKFLRWLYPRALWRMDSGRRTVFLTFDDGPIPEVTPWVLDILRHYEVKATFFMVGDNVRKHPDVYEKVCQAGHRVGNHTFNHLGSLRHTQKEYMDNIAKADALLHTDLFRPPHGWMRPSVYRVACRKYRVVMWDVVTRDYSRVLTDDDVFRNVCRYTRNGSIITFHDSLKSHEKLITALPRSIEWLREQGYGFDTL